MRWSDIPFSPSTKTLRQFAALCLVIFGTVAAWQYFAKGRAAVALVLAIAFAVRAEDLQSGTTTLRVVGQVRAGDTYDLPVASGEAVEIMTGAAVPAGADAVVMVERTRLLEPERVRIDDTVRPGLNILQRGREMQRGEVVVKRGTRLIIVAV